MVDRFAEGARMKVRFETTCGLLSPEDLWDVPLRSSRGLSLDILARACHAALQATKEVSFVDDPPQGNALAQLKFDLVLYVIEVKKAEQQAAMIAAEKAAQKARLLEVLARKQEAALAEHSLEELQEMLASL